MLADCYTRDSALLRTGYQPALVLEFARGRDLAAAPLLRGSGLDETVLLDPLRRVSPGQLLELLGRVARQLDDRDTAFVLGQQWLPGHYGAASLALMQATDLGQALAILVGQQAQLCPLLGPRLRLEADEAVLYWTDSIGAGAMLPFLVELHMTAVTALGRWLGGERLPWRYRFNRTRPRHLEQHQVHLGGELRFDCQFDAMLIDRGWLERPWPRGNAAGMALSLQQVAAEEGAWAGARSVVQAVYDQLLADIRRPPTLEGTAHGFGVSPATLKRHLARHGTHFQALLDLVRTHVSLQLMQYQGYDQAALADYLCFHDARNFRRSFKRWTGLAADLPVSAVGSG
ncbi:AraC family transcriptional regulator [Chitinimonas koreensis]|uniref:AraC family transcriptional regulator n=1 Tax=Chitinimonas koreensis TaxID=356302 RepID=UPI00041CA864|nr:AraC family transcriptional regulator [Chitinimonas koreensis]QNM98373.1 AraC family transcriptional regulator [Chitinimonas koreensis]